MTEREQREERSKKCKYCESSACTRGSYCPVLREHFDKAWRTTYTRVPRYGMVNGRFERLN